METNENVKNNENINKIINYESVEKSMKNECNPPINMEATQRIEILSGLKKDTEKSVQQMLKNLQGVSAPQMESNNEVIMSESNNENVENENVQKTVLDKSVKSNAQENLSPNFEKSVENVHENPIQKSIENNVQTQDINIQDAVVVEPNNLQSGESSNSVTNVKTKEQQHAQDKKDYRLEKMLFDRINKMQGKIKESLELIKKFERINAKEENLPNIVTTLHDKLTHEVIKQFRTVGIEFNMKSYLVQSIVSDLLCRFEEGITEFRDCSENLNFVREVQEDFESRVELAPTSKVKNFFARIRGMFKPERKQEKLEELERERQEKKLEEANIHLIKYKFINSELEKFTIKDNIVNSLKKEIMRGQGSGTTLSISDFIETKIAPEMKKLGLESSISKLEEIMYKEYKEKDSSISLEDFRSMSIGELRRNIRIQNMDLIRRKIVGVNSANNIESEELVG